MPLVARFTMLVGAFGAAAVAVTGCSERITSPPRDGRCGVTPKLLVDRSTYPVPGGFRSYEVATTGLVVNGPDLDYVVNVVETDSAAELFVGGAVMRVATAGGSPTQLASGYVFNRIAVGAGGVLVRGDNAYPHDGGAALLYIPATGEPVRTIATLGSDDLLWAGPVTDAKLAYFVDRAGVHAVSLAAEPDAAALTTVTTEVPNDLAVVGTDLVMVFPQGVVKTRSLLAGAAPDVVMRATGPSAPSDLVPCGAAACWLADGGTLLERLDPFQDAPVTVVAFSGAPAYVWDLSFDGARFYVVGKLSLGESVNAISADGRSRVSLVSLPDGSSVAVDDECVYWTGPEGIFSVAKTEEGLPPP